MDPTRETRFPPRVVFLCSIVICGILPVQSGWLIFSEGASTCSRAKERRNIFHCVIPLLPLLPRDEERRESLWTRQRGAARRDDEIAVKFLRSLRNPFSLRSHSSLTIHRKRGGPFTPLPRTVSGLYVTLRASSRSAVQTASYKAQAQFVSHFRRPPCLPTPSLADHHCCSGKLIWP